MSEYRKEVAVAMSVSLISVLLLAEGAIYLVPSGRQASSSTGTCDAGGCSSSTFTSATSSEFQTQTSTSTVSTTTTTSTTAPQGPAATLIEGEPLVVSVNGQEFLNMTIQNNLSRDELTMLTALWKNSSSGVTVAESSALIDMRIGEVANGYFPFPSLPPGTYYVGVWASSTDNQPLSVMVSFQISL